MRARIIALAAAVALPAILALGAAPAHAGGNSGTVKVSEVGGAADESNDPHVGCSFDVQWYGFDRSTSTVTFASWAPTKTAVLAVTAGSPTVALGDPASGNQLNAIQTYTLSFTGANPAAQGYHVKMTVDTARPDGRKGTSKFKTFWVSCDRADAPTDPGTTDPGTTDPGTTDPGTTDPGTTDPGTTDPGTTDPGTDDPFTWDWEYEDPTCDGVVVDYPWNIPSGQANDVNIRVETPSGSQTLNFHNNDGTWSGTHAFYLADHPLWNDGTTSYAITWIQVGGSNYHWSGNVGCVLEDGVLKTRTDVNGFRTGTLTINRGGNVSGDDVVVGNTGDEELELQQWSAGSSRYAARSLGTWTTVKAVSVASDGTARVTFPKLAKKGTYKFRLAVAGSTTSTGTTSGTLTVRVR